jgi:hypothetical protein
LPLFDTFQVVLRRLVQRRNPLSSPGKDHLHHRLLARGLSQTRTTLILWGVTLLTNLVSMLVQRATAPAGQRMSAAAIVTTTLGTVILLALVVLFRRRAARRGAAQRAARVAAGLPEDTMEYDALRGAARRLSRSASNPPAETAAGAPLPPRAPSVPKQPPLVAPPRDISGSDR